MTNDKYKKRVKPNKTGENKDIVKVKFVKFVRYNCGIENTWGIAIQTYEKYFNRNFLKVIVNLYFSNNDNITLRILEDDSDNLIKSNLIAVVKDKEIVAFIAGCTPYTNKEQLEKQDI